MKQLLRYQISGMVFIGWLVVFYFGSQTEDFVSFIVKIQNTDLNKLIFSGLLSALPIGVFIHQISVLLKNCILSRFRPEFSDFPRSCIIDALKPDNNTDSTKYILEKMSNLNSFYYVRFDNALLAPFLSFIISIYLFDVSVKDIYSELFFSIFIAIVVCFFLVRISHELIWYQDKLGYNHTKNGSFWDKFRKVKCL